VPIVATAQLHRAHREVFGGGDFDLGAYLSYDDKLGILTPNTVTPYYMAFADLGRTGPLVIDVPGGRQPGAPATSGSRPSSAWARPARTRGRAAATCSSARTTLVFATGRPARIDDYSAASGPSADLVRGFGICAGVGVPISVGGRLWGAMMAMAREQPLPADTEARLADFTELVATALANAENQAQLTASRARIVAAADQVRRRIERDLHDGAQQRLVSLGLHLRAAQAAVPPEAIELAARFDGLADEVTTALDELRELARGIHPAALAQGGLRPALKGLARRSAVPVKLDVRVDGRLPEQFETAAYYVVSEALTNAAKHAHASVVNVEADTVEDDGDGVLRIRVTDDGRGGAQLAGGSGLVGLKDRVEALGGTLTIKSPPGEGTALHATVPISGVLGMDSSG